MIDALPITLTYLRGQFARKRSWWLAGCVVLMGLLASAAPTISGHAHRANGSALLNQALELLGRDISEPDYCLAGRAVHEEAAGLVDRAIVQLETARQAMPSDAQTLLMLGRAYCLSGRLDQAIETYRALIAARPQNPLGLLELGFAYEESQMRTEAVQAWQAAGATGANFFERGDELAKNDQGQLALEWYARAGLVAPSWAQPWARIAAFHAEWEEWEAAVVYYQRAVALEAGNRDYWFQLGQAQEKLNDWEAALQAYREALNGAGVLGASDLYYFIGRLLHHHLSPPDYEQAWDAYEEALARDDFSVQWRKGNTHFQRGLLWMRDMRLEEAIAEFTLSLSFDPTHFWTNVSMANIYKRKGEPEQAISFLETALNAHPSQPAAYFPLAELYLQTGDRQKAQDIVEKFSNQFPEDEEGLEKLKTLLAPDAQP